MMGELRVDGGNPCHARHSQTCSNRLLPVSEQFQPLR